MILILTNFRCYSFKKIELPDEGIILLHGTSGIGKTSILKAITFALFGKEQKCVKHGEKKCTVELIFKNLKIVRSNSPKVVNIEIINDDDNDNKKFYEGEAAQEIINKIYGKYFNITSYVAQKSIESFVQLPLSHKMEFFNHLALKDVDTNSFKEKTKDIIKLRKDLLKDKSNEIKILKSQLESFNIPENIEYPLKSGEYNKTEIEKEKKTSKNTTDKLNNLIKDQKELQKSINELQVNKEKNDKLKLEISFLNNSIETYNNELENIKIVFPYYDKIENMINILINFLKYKIKFKEQNTEYKSFYNNLVDNSRNQISEFKVKINNLNFDDDTYNKLEHFHNNLIMFENVECDIKNLNIHIDDNIKDTVNYELKKLNIEIEKIDDNITDIKQSIVDIERKIKNLTSVSHNKNIKCPSCKTGLTIINDEIKCFNKDENDKELNFLKNKLDNIKNTLSTLLDSKIVLIDKSKQLERLNNNLKQINKYVDMLINNSVKNLITIYKKEKIKYVEFNTLKTSLDRLQFNFKNIEDGTDKTLELKQNNINKIKEDMLLYKNKKENLSNNYIEELNNCLLEYDIEFESIKSLDDLDEYEDEDMLNVLNDVLNIVRKRKINSENNLTIKNKLLTKIDEANNKLKSINLQCNNEDDNKLEEYKKKLEVIVEEIEEKSNKKEKLDKRMKKLERFMAYYSEMQRYDKLKLNIEYCEKEEKAFVISLSTSENFYKMLQEAETISISNTLENINMNIKYYMDNFFPEGNMQMELSPFKENKKGDKQTGLDIEIYFNGDKIGLDNLSGGEFDRCLLVLFLSFNAMVSGDLIMLDECLSSVNGELVEDIIDIIKSTLKGKLVIVTLHQANIGIFDKVLNLEK